MIPLVVDASVACKWFLPENGTEKAQSLLGGDFNLMAPDLLWTEVANVFWKIHRRKAMSGFDAETLLIDLQQHAVTIHPSASLVLPAFRIAVQHDRTIYDSLYVALAEREGATLVTDDRRLVNSLANSAHAARVSLLTDL